jgi:acyl-coenzyme A thioesterase PaaI-like protein
MTEALRTYAECFVCGESNPAGVHAHFSVGAAPDEMRAQFAVDARHQGYPGRTHGGILASVLDETLGRAVALQGNWTFTARLEVRYRQPVPIGATVEIVARQVRDRGRFVEAAGEARLPDGQVVADAKGLFLKLQPDQVDALRRELWPALPTEDGVGPQTPAADSLSPAERP